MIASPRDGNRLTKFDRIGLVCLLVLFMGLGTVTVIRGAYLQRRMTDLGVFLRAAWAARNGLDLYAISDDKGMLYHYPAIFAILLIPLADAPGALTLAARDLFALKVALWYAFSLALLALAVHRLAAALTDASPALAERIGPAGSRRWWGLRVLPIVACLPALGQGLSLGQVDILVLAFVCGMATAVLRGRDFQAGCWLAAAICLKVIPIFLILYPLWRRDRRCLIGCAVGLAIGLAAVPAAVLGPEQAVASCRGWYGAVLAPALGLSDDSTRNDQLLDITATRNQSVMTVMHSVLHLGEARPPKASATVRASHYVIGGMLTLLTLLAAGWQRQQADAVLFVGALAINMLLVSPVGHNHYLSLLVPLIMGLLAAGWQQESPGLQRWIMALIVLNPIASGLPMLNDLGVLHEVGTAMSVAILFWLTAVLLLRQAGDSAVALPVSVSVAANPPASRAA